MLLRGLCIQVAFSTVKLPCGCVPEREVLTQHHKHCCICRNSSLSYKKEIQTSESSSSGDQKEYLLVVLPATFKPASWLKKPFVFKRFSTCYSICSMRHNLTLGLVSVLWCSLEYMATNSSLAVTLKTVTIQLAVEQVTEAHNNASGARQLS